MQWRLSGDAHHLHRDRGNEGKKWINPDSKTASRTEALSPLYLLVRIIVSPFFINTRSYYVRSMEPKRSDRKRENIFFFLFISFHFLRRDFPSLPIIK